MLGPQKASEVATLAHTTEEVTARPNGAPPTADGTTGGWTTKGFVLSLAAEVSDVVASALRVSVDPANSALAAELQTAGVAVVAEDDAAFAARVGAETPYNVLSPGAADGFPLVGQFVSTLLCVGHVKSTKPADDDFIDAFKGSPKWLAMAQ